jgi:membrane fusion protein (multidrug efflux system)
MTRKDSDVLTIDTEIALITKRSGDGGSREAPARLEVPHDHLMQRSKSTAAGIDGQRPKPHRYRAKTTALLVAAAVVAVAASGWYLKCYRPAASAANESPAAGNEGKASLGFAAHNGGGNHAPATRVETIRAELIPCHDCLRLTGGLAADEKSEVGSNAAGNISETRVERGSFVKKGDVLVQIDPRDAQNALDEGLCAAEELRVRLGLDDVKEFSVDEVPEVLAAKVAMDLAERTLHRAEHLKDHNAVALESYDQSATDYRAAVQRYNLTRRVAKQLNRSYRSAVTHLATLRKAVDDCTIRAPFDGVVAERNISVGERVIALFPGAKLVTLLRIDPLRLSLTVPQREMARVEVGQTVTFQTDAFPNKTFSGTVRYITPSLASDNRSLCVEAIVANPDRVLRPGLFVTAELQLEQQRTEVCISQSAVCNHGDVSAVFVVRDGVAREQVVALGKHERGKTEILAGLTGSEILVAHPQQVHDGDLVR